MYNPSADGDPNCYSSSIPSTEVHAAAGPGNHWFYLLAEGTNPSGKPTSTTCNGSTGLTGIGIQNAGKIFYNAMLLKTSRLDVPEVPHLDAARGEEPDPSDCTKFNKVKAAWDAVSVPAQSADPTCSHGGTDGHRHQPGQQVRDGRHGDEPAADRLELGGGHDAVPWSATGLPTGLSIKPPAGLISGTPTTAGSSTVTVTARTASTQTGSATFTWTITGGGGGGSQLLANPGFESGATSWTGTAGPIT